ncbi:C2H2-type domain-containing protein [Mycena kentingensis (nom. inval.)]|nr:C2H2-type domain-containing protein [Mycena kentingensis (nom. inval.)]
MGQFWHFINLDKRQVGAGGCKLGEFFFHGAGDGLNILLRQFALPTLDDVVKPYIPGAVYTTSANKPGMRLVSSADPRPDSGLSSLPNELLANIFLGIEDIVDIIVFSMCSQRMWAVGRARIYSELCKPLNGLSWAGDRAIVLGEYFNVTDLPEGFLSPLEAAEFTIDGNSPDGDALEHKSLYSHSYVDSSSSVKAALGRGGSPYDTLYKIADRSDYTPESRRDMAVCRKLLTLNPIPVATPAFEHYAVLRNLTKLEYVIEDELLKLHEKYRDSEIPLAGTNLGDVAFSRICWSSTDSTAMHYDKGIHRGVWAGDRFDIVGEAWLGPAKELLVVLHHDARARPAPSRFLLSATSHIAASSPPTQGTTIRLPRNTSFEFPSLSKTRGSVARDHLASERTFLAYVRTSLAMSAAGVGLLLQVFLPAIEGHVPVQMVRALSAFLDFCYLVRQNDIGEDTLDGIEAALARYHTEREIFQTSGVCPDGFSLPRQHSISHYPYLIREFAAPNGLCSSITESKHIKAVKEPWRRSSRFEALSQMLTINNRLDNLAATRRDFMERGILVPKSGDDQQAAAEVDEEHDDDHPPLAEQREFDADVRLARNPVRGYPRDARGLAHCLNIPQLPSLLRRFLYAQENNPLDPELDLSAVPVENCPFLPSKIFCYPSAIATFYAPSDQCGPGGLLSERIRSIHSWRGGPARHDCVFVEEDTSLPGFQGLLAARVLAFLSLKHKGKVLPCAVVNWFSAVGEEPDADLGMWMVTPDLDTRRRRVVDVIHLDAIVRVLALHQSRQTASRAGGCKLGEFFFHGAGDGLNILLRQFALPTLDDVVKPYIPGAVYTTSANKPGMRLVSSADPAPDSGPVSISSLPNELLANIFLGIEDIVDVIVFSMCSQRMWAVGRARIYSELCKPLNDLSWAGDRAIVLGEYFNVTDLPEGFLSPLEAAEFTIDGNSPDGDALEHKSLYSHSYVDSSSSVKAALGRGGSPYDTLYKIADRSDYTPESRRDMAVCRKLLTINPIPVATPALEHYAVLRNLTKHEYVIEDELLKLHETYRDSEIPLAGTNLGDVAFSRICWSSTDSTAMHYDKGIHRGVWAGDRFDIVGEAWLETLNGTAEEPQWRDVSGESFNVRRGPSTVL